MSPRGAIEHLLEIHGMNDDDEQQSQDGLDAMAMALLTGLCGELAIALAGAGGRSAHRRVARDRAAEQAAAVHTVLDVWQMVGVEIIDGPLCADSPLGPPRRD